MTQHDFFYFYFGTMGKCRICRKEGHNRKKCPTTMEKISALELDLETGEITPCEMFGTVDVIQHVEEDHESPKKVRDEETILKGFDFNGLIERYKKACSECSCVLYYPKKYGDIILCCDCYYKKQEKCGICDCPIKYIYKWKGVTVCGPCYVSEQEKLSEQINEYIHSRGMTSCAFCRKLRTRIYGFHLDHINMFDKDRAIIKMVQKGEDFEVVREEIDKCQMLCVDCHMLVTGAEIACKFTSAKCRGIDERELYGKVMPVIYEKIKEFRGGGCDA
jgi:hypothetical protein